VHYVFAFSLGPILGGQGPIFTIGYRFVLGFFVLDQALSLFFYLRDSERFGLVRLLRHVVYGTASTKSCNMVVFGFLWGLQVDLALVVLTSALTFMFNKYLMPNILQMLGLPGHDVRFYMQHRIAHLPVVYTHSHKMHHHIHDTCPWDSQTYGAAINEVFFVMMFDFIPGMLDPSLWIVPSCLNWASLRMTLDDKAEHTRSRMFSQGYDAENFHADHHTFHTKNFAVPDGALLDFYFGTQAPHNKGSGGMAFSRRLVETPGDLAGKKNVITINVTRGTKEK